MITDDRSFEEYLVVGTVDNPIISGRFDDAFMLYRSNLQEAILYLKRNLLYRGNKPTAEACFKKLAKGVSANMWRVIFSTAWYIIHAEVTRIPIGENRIIVPIECISLTQKNIVLRYKSFKIEGYWEIFDSEIWKGAYTIPGTMGYITRLLDEKENPTYEIGVLLTLVKADNPKQFVYWLDHYIDVNTPPNAKQRKAEKSWV